MLVIFISGYCLSFSCILDNNSKDLGRYLNEVHELWLDIISKAMHIYLLPYSMEHSPSWEANPFSASREIPLILQTATVHYRIHKCFLCERFVTRYVFKVRSCWLLALPPSWRTAPCQLSWTAYSIYSQLPSILEGSCDCSPLSTCILYGCLQRVTIPEAVVIQFVLLRMSSVLLETRWGS